MKPIHLLAGVAMVLTASAAEARERLSSEARITKIVAGRVAGKPVDCIWLREVRSSEIIDRTAIVYTMNNGTIYVNRPSGADFLNDNEILVTNLHGSQLCSIDIVHLVDRTSQFQHGSVGLNDFVPYPKPPKSASR